MLCTGNAHFAKPIKCAGIQKRQKVAGSSHLPGNAEEKKPQTEQFTSQIWSRVANYYTAIFGPRKRVKEGQREK